MGRKLASRHGAAVGVAGEPVAAAALLLGALLTVAAWPDEAPSQGTCAHPREAAAVHGWTSEVSCVAHGVYADGPALRGPVRLLFGETLDLNRADSGSLQALPGIGPKRAEAIVRTRAESPFASVADLERVPGIGPKTRAGLARWVAVERP